ncbi:hypothetical protein F2Q68_00039663 [Brassica cretica]|uniref:Uncharacterized protein n=1 Tax=Brassica cretica TaxID=69181 RepID=A0A8S9MAS1_BRACR|nr:hypothetical protein F2Q68_00039663 [Brassica cretica]
MAPRDSGDSVSDSSTTTTPYIAPEDISGYSSSASTSVPKAQSQTAPPPPPIAPGDISVSRSISNTTKRYFIELHSNWNLIPGHIHATRKNGIGLSASMNRWKRCLSPRAPFMVLLWNKVGVSGSWVSCLQGFWLNQLKENHVKGYAGGSPMDYD